MYVNAHRKSEKHKKEQPVEKKSIRHLNKTWRSMKLKSGASVTSLLDIAKKC